MTNARYQEIKDALIAQRKEVTSSREAATKFINDAGIRHLIVEAADPSVQTPNKNNSDKKTTTKK